MKNLKLFLKKKDYDINKISNEIGILQNELRFLENRKKEYQKKLKDLKEYKPKDVREINLTDMAIQELYFDIRNLEVDINEILEKIEEKRETLKEHIGEKKALQLFQKNQKKKEMILEIQKETNLANEIYNNRHSNS
jgi:predicted  nucleic acid-binding Zn-ribbon protein